MRGLQWARGAGELLWRSWHSDEHVVFHTASGNTYILNSFAADVLRTLSVNPASLSEIVGSVTAIATYELGGNLLDQTQAVLEEFEVLGLAESQS